MSTFDNPTRRLRRLLILEDDQSVASAYEALLPPTYKISISSRVQDACRKVRSFHPHLVLVDLQLPEHNGTEFLRFLHAYPEIATVVITAYPGRYITQLINDVSVDRLLLKPVTDEDLFVRTLEDAFLLAQRRGQNQSVPQKEEEVLTVSDVVKLLKIGRTKVFHLVRNERLQSVKIGGSRRFRKSDVLKWLEEHREAI